VPGQPLRSLGGAVIWGSCRCGPPAGGRPRWPRTWGRSPLYHPALGLWLGSLAYDWLPAPFLWPLLRPKLSNLRPSTFDLRPSTLTSTTGNKNRFRFLCFRSIASVRLRRPTSGILVQLPAKRLLQASERFPLIAAVLALLPRGLAGDHKRLNCGERGGSCAP
jgi:hypothetical protein